MIPPISTLIEQRDRLLVIESLVGHSAAQDLRETAATISAVIEALQSPEGVEDLLARHRKEAFGDGPSRHTAEFRDLARTLTLKVAAAEGPIYPDDERANLVWDEVIDSCKQAWPDEGMVFYDRSPTELITRIINERDEAQSLAQRERERVDEAIQDVREILEHAEFDDGEGNEVASVLRGRLVAIRNIARAFLAKGAPHG